MADPVTPVPPPAPIPSPPRSNLPIFFAILASGLIGGAVVVVGQHFFNQAPVPAPSAPVDTAFVHLGKKYLPELGKAYSQAWLKGANDLEAGKDLATSLQTVANEWEAGRTAAFNKVLTPEFVKITPEATKAEDFTSDSRARMVRAWRGLARGMAGN